MSRWLIVPSYGFINNPGSMVSSCVFSIPERLSDNCVFISPILTLSLLCAFPRGGILYKKLIDVNGQSRLIKCMQGHNFKLTYESIVILRSSRLNIHVACQILGHKVDIIIITAACDEIYSIYKPGTQHLNMSVHYVYWYEM